MRVQSSSKVNGNVEDGELQSALRIRFCGDVCPKAKRGGGCGREHAFGGPGNPPVVASDSSRDWPASNACPAKVVVVAEGMLLGGHRRLARPNACFMIHQISSRVSGPPLRTDDLRDELENSTTISEQLADLYEARDRNDAERIAELMRREIYLRTEHALKDGIVDSLIATPDPHAVQRSNRGRGVTDSV